MSFSVSLVSVIKFYHGGTREDTEFVIFSVSVVDFYHGGMEENAENKTELNRCYLHLKLRFIFKELGHFIIHFKAIIHC